MKMSAKMLVMLMLIIVVNKLTQKDKIMNSKTIKFIIAGLLFSGIVYIDAQDSQNQSSNEVQLQQQVDSLRPRIIKLEKNK